MLHVHVCVALPNIVVGVSMVNGSGVIAAS